MKISRLIKLGSIFVFLAVACIQSAIAQDFNFTIEPGSLTLVPGQSASFVISVTPFGGFTNQVTFTATNLPSGVTVSFSPETVNSPGTSLLTLNATTNAANGAFTLELTATGGGISHMASGGVSVSFGLFADLLRGVSRHRHGHQYGIAVYPQRQYSPERLLLWDRQFQRPVSAHQP